MIIWIASYPKSGNTWVRAIISSFLNSNFDEIDINNLEIRQFPLVQDFKGLINDFKSEDQFIKNYIHAQEKINLDNQIKFFKTHNAYWKYNNYAFTNEISSLGVIHVVRDPRNVITSIMNHFSQTANSYEKALKFITDDKKMLSTKNLPLSENDIPIIISSWSNHYNSWKKFKKNNLLIKYENLLIKPESEFQKIAEFLKKTIKTKINSSQIYNTIKNTKFEKFKTQENINGFREAAKNEKNENISFFHLGPENNWKKLLSEDTKKTIESTFGNEMRELGYL
tara:strand:- start:597 stop:1442 length:846 start_codon:yes stop_codon:yes gene_type:complete